MVLIELEDMIGAGYAIIWVQTFEERKALREIEEIARRLNYGTKRWTCTMGLGIGKVPDDNTIDPVDAISALLNDKEQMIYVFMDLHRFLDPMHGTCHFTARKLRDVYDDISTQNKVIVIVSPIQNIPPDLEKAITVYDMPYPVYDDLRKVFHNIYDPFMALQDDNSKRVQDILRGQINNEDQIIRAMQGMTEDEAENIVALCVRTGNLTVKAVLEEKKQIIKKGGLLEYFDTDQNLSHVGGLYNLKEEILKMSKCFTVEAERYGVVKPRGCLFIGPPGTGKGLSTKVVAEVMQLPLFRLDASRIMTSYYSDSTARVARALKQCESNAPCILWLDEVEKLLAGDHEETQRMLSTILTWMQETKFPVIIVATCNTPNGLRPEFMQRLNLFLVDLPREEERKEILGIHLRKIGRDPENFDIDYLAKNTENYVGREIEAAIGDATRTAFYEGVEITTAHIHRELSKKGCMFNYRKADIDAVRLAAHDAGMIIANDKPAKAGQNQENEQKTRIVKAK